MGRPKINVPKQETYGEAYRSGLEAQIELAPELMASEREFRPQQQQLDIDLLRSALYGSDGQAGLLDMYGGAGAGARAQEVGMGQYTREQAAADKRAQVEGDMALVREYGAEARDAFKEANPLMEALERDAMQSIEGQGRLSDQERREISQPLLAQYTAAGRSFDNAAAQDLFRRTDDVRNQRLMQARGYGTQVAGMRQQYDPFMAILGRQGTGNQIYGQQMGMAGGLNKGAFFNPEAGVGYTSQAYANQVNLAGAQAAARGNAMGGLFSGLGTAVGGMAQAGMFCWVAREVYGETNPKWVQFRQWLIYKAPMWLVKLYYKHGEKFAKYISNKPALKNIIRNWMDRRIA